MCSHQLCVYVCLSSLQAVQLVPALPTRLLPMLVQNMPHKLRDRSAQCLYLSAVIALCEGKVGPALREGLLSGLVEHLLSIDADIRWEDIVDAPTGTRVHARPLLVLLCATCVCLWDCLSEVRQETLAGVLESQRRHPQRSRQLGGKPVSHTGPQPPASHRHSPRRHCALDRCSNSVLHLCRVKLELACRRTPRCISAGGIAHWRDAQTLCCSSAGFTLPAEMQHGV